MLEKMIIMMLENRVVESESVESHVFSWSRSLESESVFKTAGVGVGFLKLLESENLLQLPTPMFIK